MSPNDTAQTSTLQAGAPAGTRGSAPAGASSRTAGSPGRSAPAGTLSADGSDASGRSARPVKSSNRGPRRARLQLRNVDTWSALKISLVLSIAFFFVWMVAVGLLYGILSGLGVFGTLNDILGQLNSGTSSGGEVTASEFITPKIVFGGAAVIGAINVVLFTALCTVGTLMYNLCADLVGGLEVTLSERD